MSTKIGNDGTIQGEHNMKRFKAIPGKGITTSTKYVKANGAASGNAQIIKILKDHGIDTTKCQYELYAEEYMRMYSGGKYKKKFTCPGNYLAYFAMNIHGTPNYENIDDHFGIDYFEEIVNDNPTIKDIEDYASSSWWGDGDDYIIYLKNLTTGEVLYQAEEEDEYEEEDEWDED